MPLDKSPLDREVVIVDCAADADLRRRLATLGVLPGARVTPLRATHGNLVLRVCDGRLAIDRGLANRINVV